MLTEYYFWFAQPSTILNTYDKVFGYIFAGLLVLSVLGWLVNRFLVKHAVVEKLLGRWVNSLFWTGFAGLIWFGFRYQAIPIFSKRAFAGGVMLMGLIWLGFVKWYLVRNFLKEKREYDYNLVKNKYIPGRR